MPRIPARVGNRQAVMFDLPTRSRLRPQRLAREYRTIAVMIDTYCRAHHHASGGACASCTDLLDYAGRRLHRCPFRDKKPTCAKCAVHCYSDERRQQVKTVMRYAGPRVMWAHPMLALAHVRDGWRPVPHLPKPRSGACRGATLETRRASGI
jgi:hypothetical protein